MKLISVKQIRALACVAVLSVLFVPPAGFVGSAAAASFSYSYAAPQAFSAGTYVDSVVDAGTFNESVIWAYKPNTGSTSSDYTVATPGVITYKFDFGPEIVGSAFLKSNQPTFRQAYSAGYNLLFGSKDGSNWEQLLEVTTPTAIHGSNSGLYNQLLPSSLLGGNQLWFKVELYVIDCVFNAGQSCNTNTAQHSRWDRTTGFLAETFKLEVDYGVSAVPLPAAFPLFASGLGVLGLMGWRKKKRRSVA